MSEQIDNQLNQHSDLSLGEELSSVESTSKYPWRRFNQVVATGLTAVAFATGGLSEANASTPEVEEGIIPVEPISLYIPATGNVENTPVLMTGPPWGNKPGQWGSLTPEGWVAFHIKDPRTHRPGQIGASFMGAHSNLNSEGELDVGGNFIDDKEFPDRYGIEDQALEVGDEIFITMDDGSVVKQTIFDLREYIEEIPGLINYLSDEQGVGVYIPKEGLWENGATDILKDLAEEKGWSVTYLFASYGGPSSNEWMPSNPRHRKYQGVVAARSEVFEVSPTGINPSKEQVLVPVTGKDGEIDFIALNPSTTIESAEENQIPTVDEPAETTDITTAAQERITDAKQALAEQEVERAEAEAAQNRVNTYKQVGRVAAATVVLLGGFGAVILNKPGQDTKRRRQSK